MGKVYIQQKSAFLYILRAFWSTCSLARLYIEERAWTCHVPVRPLHPASSTCRPASRKVLTTQRARKTQYNFSGKFHPDLQRLVNTEKARLLLEVDVDSGGWNGQFLFPFDGLTAQTITQGKKGLIASRASSYFLHHEQLCLGFFWPHSQCPQTINSPHMLLTRKLCWLNCHDTFKSKKWRNGKGSTSFKSSMFCSSWLFRENARPFSCQKLNKH